MSYDSVGDKIRATFRAAWEAAEPNVEYFGPNRAPAPDFAEPWVALDILDGASMQINVDPPQWRRNGVVSVSVFVPVNTGDGVLRRLIDSSSAILQGQTFVDALGLNIVFQGTDVAHVGSTDTHSQTNVLHDYHYDEV